MSIKHVADPKFTLRDIQRRHVKSPIASLRTLARNPYDGMISMTWCVKCNPTDSGTKDAIYVQDHRNVGKEEFKIILLNGGHRCGTVQELKEEGRLKRTESPRRLTQFICRYG